MTELCLEGCVCCSFWRGSGQWSMADPGLFEAVGTQEVQPGRKVWGVQKAELRGTPCWDLGGSALREEGTGKSWRFQAGP